MFSRQLLGVTIATAVGAAFFNQPSAAEAVDLILELPNSETAGNRGVRFSGGAKQAGSAKARREAALKERVALLKSKGFESTVAKQ